MALQDDVTALSAALDSIDADTDAIAAAAASIQAEEADLLSQIQALTAQLPSQAVLQQISSLAGRAAAANTKITPVIADLQAMGKPVPPPPPPPVDVPPAPTGDGSTPTT